MYKANHFGGWTVLALSFKRIRIKIIVFLSPHYLTFACKTQLNPPFLVFFTPSAVRALRWWFDHGTTMVAWWFSHGSAEKMQKQMKSENLRTWKKEQ